MFKTIEQSRLALFACISLTNIGIGITMIVIGWLSLYNIRIIARHILHGDQYSDHLYYLTGLMAGLAALIFLLCGLTSLSDKLNRFWVSKYGKNDRWMEACSWILGFVGFGFLLGLFAYMTSGIVEHYARLCP